MRWSKSTIRRLSQKSKRDRSEKMQPSSCRIRPTSPRKQHLVIQDLDLWMLKTSPKMAMYTAFWTKMCQKIKDSRNSKDQTLLVPVLLMMMPTSKFHRRCSQWSFKCWEIWLELKEILSKIWSCEVPSCNWKCSPMPFFKRIEFLMNKFSWI